jgi:hypothetical protein
MIVIKHQLSTTSTAQAALHYPKLAPQQVFSPVNNMLCGEEIFEFGQALRIP